MSRIRVSFDGSDAFLAYVEVDLTQMLGSPKAYYDLSRLSKADQGNTMYAIMPALVKALSFHFGDEIIEPELIDWTIPTADRTTFDDYYTGKMARLTWRGKLPASRAPFTLVVEPGALIEYPVAYTLERVDKNVRFTRWLDIGGQKSKVFDYYNVQASASNPVLTEKAVESGQALPNWLRILWVNVETLWRYLVLGFHHIVPEGADHILFVLGLFFLGISWKKLISQTTVFTVAHATTLYLSMQKIFSLPPWFVEPAIAASIAFIALENIIKPRLSAMRLVVVFCFGLIHGLGFASSLSDVPLPKKEFLTALLGFNFGVDFGQLFVMTLAFLCVGWWRNKGWYFQRIAIPCSAVVSLIGLYWMIERIIFFAAHRN